ncbi:hypothetical protein DTL21_28125 [Bremerella cremea]|uniref:Uncharacterized protein n=1 Tax=Blastopirellula marina TaxID=124 RepID=A0A2S8F8J1_9BACT|nr:hypothetical protein C5Y83_28080 [Blastopirellula marina]RCS41840.1 hypothetical protein DTL21_28125 [Bremerella cremea]
MTIQSYPPGISLLDRQTVMLPYLAKNQRTDLGRLSTMWNGLVRHNLVTTHSKDDRPSNRNIRLTTP